LISIHALAEAELINLLDERTAARITPDILLEVKLR
jgi:hypothetical protein